MLVCLAPVGPRPQWGLMRHVHIKVHISRFRCDVMCVCGEAAMEEKGTRIQMRRHRIESKHVATEDPSGDKKEAEEGEDRSTGALRVAESLAALDAKKVQGGHVAGALAGVDARGVGGRGTQGRAACVTGRCRSQEVPLSSPHRLFVTAK